MLDRESIDAMMEGGAVGVNVSLESASPRMQKVMRKNLNIPHTLKELKVEFDFDTLASMALNDPSTAPNPKDINLSEMKQLYIDSYEGNL